MFFLVFHANICSTNVWALPWHYRKVRVRNVVCTKGVLRNCLIYRTWIWLQHANINFISLPLTFTTSRYITRLILSVIYYLRPYLSGASTALYRLWIFALAFKFFFVIMILFLLLVVCSMTDAYGFLFINRFEIYW